METNLIYGVNDRPTFGKIIVFALQQLLAILAATIAVPRIIGNGMSQSAALFGAGAGTLIYLLFTKFKSPVFLGSSFAFLGSMGAAFAGAATTSMGFTGLLIGAILAGLVYVIISLLIKTFGTAWINKLLPPVIIGPAVAIIGLSLAGNAVGDLLTGVKVFDEFNVDITPWGYCFVGLLCGLVTLITVIISSIYGKKMVKMIPFIIGISAGYAVAAILTGIGYAADVECLKIVNFKLFNDMQWYPDFTFIEAFKGFKDFESASQFFKFFGTIALAYVPVSLVVFAEHIADHKNLSSIIGQELLEDPGLDNTLLGDGVGSMVGAFFGGCPNTTYGESVGCVAISGNASVITIFVTAIMAIAISFIAPFTTLLATIPSCVMGGVCFTLYGFIAVSGLKMLQPVDLNDNRNLFTASVILIAGVGGLVLSFGKDADVQITEVACALLLGILVNFICSFKKDDKASKPEKIEDEFKIEIGTEEVEETKEVEEI